MSELENNVIEMFIQQYPIWKIANELDMTEFEVLYILKKHHYK